jgi:cytochrome b561
MPPIRYSTGAILLHWAIAIAVIVNWRIAESAEHLPDATRGAVMANHMALGMTILLLTLLRLAWRITHTPPPYASSLKPWERGLARIVHAVFYVLLIGLPLGGWLATSFYGVGVNIWGLFTVPGLPVPTNEHLGHEIFHAHAFGGTVMLVLIALHVLGALKHQFFDRDGNIWRMLPWGTPKA